MMILKSTLESIDLKIQKGVTDDTSKVKSFFYIFEQVLILLVNFLTDFICSRGGSQNELCVLQLLDADVSCF